MAISPKVLFNIFTIQKMFYVLSALSSLISPNADALETLEQSLQSLQKRLEKQEKLKELLIEYNSLKKRFIQENISKSEAWRMVKISEEMCKLIEQEHLEPLFSMEFIEEIKVFSSFATKSSVVLKGKEP